MDHARDTSPWPVFRSLRGGTISSVGRDLLAGLTLVAIAIPEQMATARLGGFPPQIGFFAFAAACLGFAVFGASRSLSAGADSTITPIFAGGLALIAAAGSPDYAALAGLLALMVGVIVCAAGVFRLGWVADFLSAPVLTGFMAAIAVHIGLSQAPTLLGLPAESGDVYHRLLALWRDAPTFNLPSLLLGLGVFLAILGAERLPVPTPGALIGVFAATLATAALGLERRGVAVIGAVPAALPGLVQPHVTFERVASLGGLAFIVSLVVMVQTAATTRSFPAEGQEPDVARDYLGVGVGSLLAGLFGAFPVNASPPRTAIVEQSGGRSQVSGLAAALMVLLLAAFGAGLLRHVPEAALAGVLMFVASRIVNLRVFVALARTTPAEFALALAALALIVVLPIQTGVAVGIILSLIHGVFTITRARPIVFERRIGTTIWWPRSSLQPGESAPFVLVMGYQAPLSFLNAYEFRRGLLDAVAQGRGSVRLLVLETSSMVEIDFTAAGVMVEVIAKARAAGMDFAIARLESTRAEAALKRFGVIKALGPDHVFQSVEEAVRTLSPAVSGSAAKSPKAAP